VDPGGRGFDDKGKADRPRVDHCDRFAASPPNPEKSILLAGTDGGGGHGGAWSLAPGYRFMASEYMAKRSVQERGRVEPQKQNFERATRSFGIDEFATPNHAWCSGSVPNGIGCARSRRGRRRGGVCRPSRPACAHAIFAANRQKVASGRLPIGDQGLAGALSRPFPPGRCLLPPPSPPAEAGKERGGGREPAERGVGRGRRAGLIVADFGNENRSINRTAAAGARGKGEPGRVWGGNWQLLSR